MNPKKNRVLIVDGNDNIRNNLSEVLLRKGFEIGIAENSVEALKIFNKKGFDLVLTDFSMPTIDGFTLACEIRKRQPKTVIVMMSTDKKMSVQIKEVANYLMIKPFVISKMCDLINAAFDSETTIQSPQNNDAL